MMDYPKTKSDKIREIVRLQQIVKKWKRLANGEKSSNKAKAKGMQKEEAAPIPKGYLAVCVGIELKRFVIPTHYLTHQAFQTLLRQAEEEFGFHQEGVLQIPCEVSVFQNVLNHLFQNSPAADNQTPTSTPHHHPQMCT